MSTTRLSLLPTPHPKDVCDCLKTLQTGNAPFPDEEAWAVMADESGCVGPVAPGCVPLGCVQPDAKPLFKVGQVA